MKLRVRCSGEGREEKYPNAQIPKYPSTQNQVRGLGYLGTWVFGYLVSWVFSSFPA
jgi:hypothetical protein